MKNVWIAVAVAIMLMGAGCQETTKEIVTTFTGNGDENVSTEYGNMIEISGIDSGFSLSDLPDGYSLNYNEGNTSAYLVPPEEIPSMYIGETGTFAFNCTDCTVTVIQDSYNDNSTVVEANESNATDSNATE